MTTVLLTGFEPFGGDAANPAADAVGQLARTWNGPERLVTAVLPVAFAEAGAELERLVDRFEPEVVVSIGLAGGRDRVTPERVAINVADARIADNAGARPIDEPVVPGGPAAYFSGLPVKRIVDALDADGVPAAVSNSAGTFVCNHVFYLGAHLAAGRPGLRAGFVHVPWSAETAPAGEPSLPAAVIARAVERVVRTAIDHEVDVRTPGGAIA